MAELHTAREERKDLCRTTAKELIKAATNTLGESGEVKGKKLWDEPSVIMDDSDWYTHTIELLATQQNGSGKQKLVIDVKVVDID